MAEDAVQGVNYLTNLYLRAFYSYHFLSEILHQDEYLQDYSRKFEYSSKIAQSNAQTMTDYLYSNGKRFILMEPPRIVDFDLKKAAELDRTIRYCIRRLERMALRDNDDTLLEILKNKLVKRSTSGASSQVVKLCSEETRVEAIETVELESKAESRDGDTSQGGKYEEDKLMEELKNFIEQPQATLGRIFGDVLLPQRWHPSDQISARDESDVPSYSPTSGGQTTVSGDRPSEFPLPLEDDLQTLDEQGTEGATEQVEEENSSNESSDTTHVSEALEHQDSENQASSKDKGLEVRNPDEQGALQTPPAHQFDDTFTLDKTIDPSALSLAMRLKLKWNSAPSKILLVKKLMAPQLNDGFVYLILWFSETHPEISLYVEAGAVEEESFAAHPAAEKVTQLCSVIYGDKEDLSEEGIDLVISIGGDGTLLHASSLFPQRMPPVAAFRTGTLNYLVPFKFDRGVVESVLNDALRGEASVNIRSRIMCTVNYDDGPCRLKHTALNEIAITRGCSPHLCKVEVYLDKQKLARVDGDGILLCTPTGSTAYGLAAGGSVLHPAVACMQIVPIAPHSICTRSIVIPASAEVQFALAPDSRSDATVTSDGIKTFQMSQSEKLTVLLSPHPLPILFSIPSGRTDSDWLTSFHWCKKVETSAESPSEQNAVDDEMTDQDATLCKPCALAKPPH